LLPISEEIANREIFLSQKFAFEALINHFQTENNNRKKNSSDLLQTDFSV